jgi:hypothetical protein
VKAFSRPWLIAVLPGAVACASGSQGRASNATSGEPTIAVVHARGCGKCHALPEPGAHARTELEAAFGRHSKRVRLTADEWRAMLDYLAAPDAGR